MKTSAAKLAIRLLQWGLLLAILIYLGFDIHRNRSFSALWDEPKRWDLLAAATVIALMAVSITIIRWHWLLRALDLPLTWSDTFRLGFLGFLLNFVSLGSVGGDLFKAVFTARKCPGHRPEAVATIIVDRLLGLYAVFLLASIGILTTGAARSGVNADVQGVCRVTLITTAVSTALVAIYLLPDFSRGALTGWLTRIPKVGPIIQRLLAAGGRYRRKPGVLAASLLASLAAQVLYTIGFYLVAAGLLDAQHRPSLTTHFVIFPLATLVGVLPMPANGLGVLEFAIDKLYRYVTMALEPGVQPLDKNQGLMVSLGYRIVTIAVALVGVFYYLASRREVSDVMHEVEEQHVDSLLDAGEENDE